MGHRLLGVLAPISYLLVTALLAFLLQKWKKLCAPLWWLTLGFVWANIFAANLIEKQIPLEIEKRDVLVTGRVASIPMHFPHYTRFDYLIDSLSYQGVEYPSPGKVRLKAYHDQRQIKLGQSWELTVRLKRPHGYQNPGGRFDYETYLFGQGIRGVGYIRHTPPGRQLSEGESAKIGKSREAVFEFIQEHLGDRSHAGILTALLVGIRGTMSDQQWQVLQNTGTIHLVAISGLHIGLVFALVSGVMTRVWRFSGQWQCVLPAKRWGAICGFVVAFLYALMAGMTVPTRRALTMLGIIVMASLSNRRPSIFETMILVLSGILLFDPLAPLSSGFWLSFGAVFAITLCLRDVRQRETSGLIEGGVHRVVDWSRIQIGIFVGMMPLLLLMFHQVSLVAPIANMVAVPVVGLLVVPAALLGLTGFALGFEYIALMLFEFSLWIMGLLWPILHWMAGLNGAIWQIQDKPIALFVCAFLGLALLSLPSVFLPRWLGAFWLLPIFITQPQKINQAEFRYTMLEVGHGLASVIETRNHVLVYDTGPGFVGGMNAGKSIVNPYLVSRGVTVIDTVVLSHDHNDHIGGYGAIQEKFEILQTLAGVPDATDGARFCHYGQAWTWDDVRFEILWPVEEGLYEKNNASCVLKVSSVHGSLLLTGDIEKEAELKLALSSEVNLHSTVLQVPHQGSKTSSTNVFLDAVDPHYGFLSTGYLNRFNHPHDVVVERYLSRDIPLLNTAHQGALTVLFGDKGTIHGHREQRVGYWYFKAKGGENMDLKN